MKRILIPQIVLAINNGETLSTINALIQQHIDDFNLITTVPEWKISNKDKIKTQLHLDREGISSDTLIQQLKNRTPQKAADFIKSKIQSGAINRDDVFEKLVKIVTYMLRNE